MNKNYPWLHWFLTLLLAPFFNQVINFFWSNESHSIVSLLEVFPVTFFFSLFFSVPCFIIYYTCFYFLSKHNISALISKIILISIAVLGIYITQSIIKGSATEKIIITYGATAILVGLVLKIKKTKSP